MKYTNCILLAVLVMLSVSTVNAKPVAARMTSHAVKKVVKASPKNELSQKKIVRPSVSIAILPPPPGTKEVIPIATVMSFSSKPEAVVVTIEVDQNSAPLIADEVKQKPRFCTREEGVPDTESRLVLYDGSDPFALAVLFDCIAFVFTELATVFL